MWILISTDLQLLTYIHIWNIDKNLFFNNIIGVFQFEIYNINNAGNTMYSRGNIETYSCCHGSSSDLVTFFDVEIVTISDDLHY